MKRERRKFWKALIFIVLFAILAFLSIGCTSAATHYVNSGESIQAAVNAADPNDTIIVRDGTYIENVDVNKRLTIQSENGYDNCIVQAANSNDHVFSITADYVNIRGFTVTGVSGSYKGGIYGEYIEHCNISNNYASNTHVGIYLHWSSSNNIIINNHFSNNYISIYLDIRCTNNEITSNIISNMTDYSILLHGFCSNNIITNNTISNNHLGIYIRWDSTNNRIIRNNINVNDICIGFHDGASNNVFYLNNFINNSQDATFTGYGPLTNIWSSPEKITYTYVCNAYTNNMGNYWGDYTGTDANNDGIGDTPYNMPESNSDAYPLMQPFEDYLPPESPPSGLLFKYTGDVLPSEDGWAIINWTTYESIGAHVEDGVLNITDSYTYPHSAIHYIKQWSVSQDYINVAEFDVKSVSCSGLIGIYIGTSDDNYNMLYTIFPDRIQSRYADNDPGSTELHLGKIYYFDTTSQFNTYKTVIDTGIAKLYINGELVLEQPAGIDTRMYQDVNGVEFGAGSSSSTGEAYFDEIRAYTIGPTKPTVSFNPSKLKIPLNSTNIINLTLDSAQNGLSGYNITISLPDTNVAEIVSFDLPAWATLHSDSTLPTDSFWLKVADLDDQIKSGATNITLVTLTLRGDVRGICNILINVTRMDDDSGEPIEPNTLSGQIEVEPLVISFPGCDNPPTDPNGDGLYEDINGNGREDFNDVIVFFNYLEWVEENQPCVKCFDFNGNNRIDFDDVVKLFEDI